MACFPFFAWATTSTASVSVTVGATTVSGAITGLYGWGVNASSTTARTDTVAGWIRDKIIAAGGSATATYTQDIQGTVAPVSYTIANAGGAATVAFGTVAVARLFGFTAATVVLPAAASTSNTINPGLCWAPCPRAFSLFSRKRTLLGVTGSEMANVQPTVTGWGTISNATFEASIVPSANIWLDFAQNANFAAAAQRNVADPNNLLENLAEAVGDNLSFRVWQTNAGFETYYVTDPGFGDTAARCTPVDAPRYYMVGFNVRKA